MAREFGFKAELSFGRRGTFGQSYWAIYIQSTARDKRLQTKIIKCGEGWSGVPVTKHVKLGKPQIVTNLRNLLCWTHQIRERHWFDTIFQPAHLMASLVSTNINLYFPPHRSIIYITRSLGALRAPTSSWWPFGPAWLRPSRPSGAQAGWPTQRCGHWKGRRQKCEKIVKKSKNCV